MSAYYIVRRVWCDPGPTVMICARLYYVSSTVDHGLFLTCRLMLLFHTAANTKTARTTGGV